MDCPLPPQAGQREPPRVPAAPGSETAAGPGCEAASEQAWAFGAAGSGADLEAGSASVADEAALPAQAASTPAASCSFHIAYSASYGVPLLLFDAREPGVPVAVCDNRHALPQATCVMYPYVSVCTIFYHLLLPTGLSSSTAV